MANLQVRGEHLPVLGGGTGSSGRMGRIGFGAGPDIEPALPGIVVLQATRIVLRAANGLPYAYICTLQSCAGAICRRSRRTEGPRTGRTASTIASTSLVAWMVALLVTCLANAAPLCPLALSPALWGVLLFVALFLTLFGLTVLADPASAEHYIVVYSALSDYYKFSRKLDDWVDADWIGITALAVGLLFGIGSLFAIGADLWETSAFLVLLAPLGAAAVAGLTVLYTWWFVALLTACVASLCMVARSFYVIVLALRKDPKMGSLLVLDVFWSGCLSYAMSKSMSRLAFGGHAPLLHQLILFPLITSLTVCAIASLAATRNRLLREIGKSILYASAIAIVTIMT